MGEDANLSATHANSCVIEPAAALCETNNKINEVVCMIYRLIELVIKHYIIGRRLGENAKLSAAHAVDSVQDNTVGILA